MLVGRGLDPSVPVKGMANFPERSRPLPTNPPKRILVGEGFIPPGHFAAAHTPTGGMNASPTDLPGSASLRRAAGRACPAPTYPPKRRGRPAASPLYWFILRCRSRGLRPPRPPGPAPRLRWPPAPRGSGRSRRCPRSLRSRRRCRGPRGRPRPPCRPRPGA